MYQYIKNLSLLKKYLVLGLLLHLISCYFSIGFYADDEHYQILEPLAYLLGINEILLNDNRHWYWEWELQMRPWLQPTIYYYLVVIFKTIGINNSFDWTFLIRLLSSLLGFCSLVYLFKTVKELFFKENNHFNYLLFFTFWFYPFLHSRTSSENLSLTLFIFAFCFLFKQLINSNTKNNLFLNFLLGLLLGFSLVIRFNLIFTILPIFVWIIFFRFNFYKLLPIFLGVITSLIIGLVIDSINYN